MLWSQGPDLQPAVSAISRDEDAAQITQSLDSARHPVQARRRRRHRQRAGRAAQRRAPEARGAGPAGKRRRLSPMTKDPGFGVSQFMENARYQHALETELARTIASLQHGARARACIWRCRSSPRSCAIAGRRVRLGVPAVEGRPPARRRAGAGRSSTSSPRAFPSSNAAQVTVVDQPGPSAVRARQRQRASRMREQHVRVRAPPGRGSYAQRIEALLTPLVGAGPRARAGRGADRHVDHRSRRASSTTRRARSCAASRLPKKPRRNGGGGAGGVPGRADQPAAAARRRVAARRDARGRAAGPNAAGARGGDA